jgi:hypothetical protein
MRDVTATMVALLIIALIYYPEALGKWLAAVMRAYHTALSPF